MVELTDKEARQEVVEQIVKGIANLPDEYLGGIVNVLKLSLKAAGTHNGINGNSPGNGHKEVGELVEIVGSSNGNYPNGNGGVYGLPGVLEYDPDTHLVKLQDEQKIHLTNLEDKVFQLILYANGNVVRHAAFEEVFGAYGAKNPAKKIVMRLRDKLGDKDRNLIQTIHHVGYRLGFSNPNFNPENLKPDAQYEPDEMHVTIGGSYWFDKHTGILYFKQPIQRKESGVTPENQFGKSVETDGSIVDLIFRPILYIPAEARETFLSVMTGNKFRPVVMVKGVETLSLSETPNTNGKTSYAR